MSKENPTIVTCTICGKQTTGAKAMQAHLRDKHQLTGRRAHLIANPHDKQARDNHRLPKRRVAPMVRPAKDPDDDFEVIE